jgi:choline dehydrogenase-like flavoprotein
MRTSKPAASEAATQRFDAIVIGSGISGGWAAKELTEKGLRVLMLDRGRMVEHSVDYTYEGKGPWEIPYNGTLPPSLVERDYFIQKHGGGDQADSNHYYNNDRLNPYAFDEGQPFRWIRPAVVGGKSLIWGRACFRWGPQDFEANKRDGHGNDWPIRYDDLAPWYSYVERYAGVAGSKEGLAHLPDSEFQPPHPLSAAEHWLQERLAATMPGRHLIPLRTSNMTEDKPEQGRTRCQHRLQCWRGCSFGAYFSTQAVTLPAARATGRLTLLPDQVVTSIDYDPVARRVTGVRAVDANTMAATRYEARIVFLCASAMASLQILLNSRLPGSDRSFADESGILGRYVMDHTFQAGAYAEVPVPGDVIPYGRNPAGSYIPRFRNLGADEGLGFVRGYAFQGGADRRMSAPKGFGADMKAGLRTYGPWIWGATMFGECLPYADNRVTLHPTKIDRYGVPLAVFDVTFRENEKRMIADAIEQISVMLKAAGAINPATYDNEHVPGHAIHEMGGARMGRDPNDSVLNGWSQAHAAANLFVTDGAQMASSSCVNPSLTYMALTARAADRAVTLLKEGQL